jgi:hypothetical protein
MPPVTAADLPAGAETSPRSAQNTLLSLGGVLLAISAVVFAGLFYTTTQTGGRAFILVVSTTLALGIPVLLARRRLTATAETIAGIGMLLVLLDGYVAYTSDLAGVSSLPGTLYAAILFALVAAVALAYRLATHLRAPQFAGLLAVQPLLPLIAVHVGVGRDGLAAVLALVAAENLAAVVALRREPVRRPRLARDGAATTPLSWPRMLRELAWVLFGLAMASSAGLITVSLVRADTVGEAVRATLAVAVAAAVGITAGQVSGREAVRHVATGAAALAVIVSVSRINALALPDYTLVLTAAVATGIALVSTFLPPESRQGAQLGSLVGAALVAAAVTVSGLGTAVATVRSATSPRPWMADLTAYADRVHTTTWQVPVAAILLSVLAIAATPTRWRTDAAVLGAGLTVLTAPGTGLLSWWAVPLLGVGGAAIATGAALHARRGESAIARTGTAGVLGLHAVASGLARPELTAATCILLAVVALGVTVAVAGRADWFGPYADRVADAAGGAAAFTLPIAVATIAHLVGAPARVLLPLTMLATAAGVLGAALSQVAAATPRTGSAGGALAAAAGCVLLSFAVDGAAPADYLLATLLFVAAAATASARAFELSAEALITGAVAAPLGTGAVEGGPGTPERSGRFPSLPRLGGAMTGAALATAGLIVAMARLAAVAVPGIGLVTTTAMVFAVSLGVLVLPEPWRRGPRLGAGAVGASIVLVLAAVALIEAGRVISAGLPLWAADLASWPEKAAGWAPYGWQVPASLLLAGAAAWALMPRPTGGDIGFVALSLAGLSAPAALGLTWWSPIAIAGGLSLLAGLGAALLPRDDPASMARRRLGLAAALGLYAVAASAPRPAATALALSGVLAAGVLVAAVGHTRSTYPVVPGVATAAALTAAPGAAATLAAANGATRSGVLGTALTLSVFGVLVLVALRAAGTRWGPAPAFGVGAAALTTALAAVPGQGTAQVWSAAAALVAVGAAATLRTASGGGYRSALAVIVTTGMPSAVLAAVLSAPAWLVAVVGPYRTLRQVWAGYAVAPAPQGARTAMLTLLLLAAVAAAAAAALGGHRYVLAAALPPLAALALVVPAAVGAPRPATAWVCLGVALATGLGAALSPAVLPPATRLLRSTAGLICAVTGAAGVAGSLATRASTIIALAVVLAGAAVAASLGRDPAIRMVAWVVASAAGFALPVTVLAATGRTLRPGAFGVLAVSGVLIGVAWVLATRPGRRAEAGVVELSAALGAAFALLLTLGSARHAAAVLTIWGVLLGSAALRKDRTEARRHWLFRSALAAEVGACWLLLYSAEVGLAEAYTLPFALVALLAGVLELRRRPELSSWVAYGPALAGGFLPSLALVLVGEDALWRWVTLFAAAIATVIVGSWRRRRAPVVTGATVAVLVAVTEMIRLLIEGAVAGAILVAIAGLILIGFGAVSEKRLRGALRNMS